MENDELEVLKNPLELIKERMSACFGAKDQVFGEQNQEFKRAKDLFKYAKLNGVSLDQFLEIATDYLQSKAVDAAHIEKQLARIRKKGEAKI